MGKFVFNCFLNLILLLCNILLVLWNSRLYLRGLLCFLVWSILPGILPWSLGLLLLKISVWMMLVVYCCCSVLLCLLLRRIVVLLVGRLGSCWRRVFLIVLGIFGLICRLLGILWLWWNFGFGFHSYIFLSTYAKYD